jgi:hypothetical protein
LAIRYYLDENVEIAVAVQLRLRGIDVVTVRDIGQLGDTDINHLTRASAMGYVLCTYDRDYLQLAQDGVEHNGIIFANRLKTQIGDWVRQLVLIHAIYTPEDMHNYVEYL